jgi:hypothetical protein
LPETAFFAPPAFLVSPRRKSAYDAAALRLGQQVGRA